MASQRTTAEARKKSLRRTKTDAGGGTRTPDTRIMIGPGGVRLAKVSQVYSGCLQLSSVGFDLSGTNSGPTYGVDPYKARRDRRLHADLLVAVLSEPGDSRQADEQPGYPYAVPFDVGFWVKVAKRLRFFCDQQPTAVG